jgi:hypothetical protein
LLSDAFSLLLQNCISLLMRCPRFAFLVGCSRVVCCDTGLVSIESLLRSPKPPTNRDMLAMLLLFALISAVAELRIEKTDGARPYDDGGGTAIDAACTTGLAIVDRLLDKLGTSSIDMRISGPGSPNVNGRLSLIDDVPVPSLDVSNDA